MASPDDTDALLGSLDDLGRRIDAAKVDADRRAAAGAPRRFPLVWLAVALLVAVVAGGLVLASSDGDDDGDVAAGQAETTTSAVDETGDEAAGAGTTGGSDSTSPAEPTTTAAPSTTDAPTTVTTAAETTTTAAPASTTTAPPTTVPPATSPPGTTTATSDGPTAASGEVTVEAGDSFWAIAEDVLGDRLGHPPSDAEITPWWADFVAANADRLVQPGNPNLILPGQVLVLPAGTG